MRLLRLRLENFRNYVRLDEPLPPGAVLLVGGNAEGKTNLLEAVYYFATLTSFRARSDRELLNFDAPVDGYPVVGRLVAEFQREDERRAHKMEIRLILDANGEGERLRREVLIDGVRQKRLGDALGMFNAVLFLPDMLTVVTGAPEERRRYLDMVLSQAERNYAGRLVEYRQAVTQRNALLKRLAEQGGDEGQLDFWDERVARLGAALMAARGRALEELSARARRAHWALTRQRENLHLRYHPAYIPDNDEEKRLLEADEASLVARTSPEELAAGMRRALARRRREDIARGVTTLGPHRDDFRFLNDRRDLGLYGSRGQVRTAMLALKMAEMEWLKERTGFRPVLLLDEILAELDAARRDDLQAHLAQSEQVLLTTTDYALFRPEFLVSSQVWRLEGGVVLPEKQALP